MSGIVECWLSVLPQPGDQIEPGAWLHSPVRNDDVWDICWVLIGAIVKFVHQRCRIICGANVTATKMLQHIPNKIGHEWALLHKALGGFTA